MPLTHKLLHWVGRMTWVTDLVQIRSIYMMHMTKNVQKYLTIILSWDKYQYLKIPMGLSISANVFQREMTKLFDRLEYVLVYINDILVVTKGKFTNHLKKLHTVLMRMQEKSMQLEPKKLFFCTKKVKYSGYVITLNRLQVQQSKVNAIFNIALPQTMAQLIGFVPLVNFYQDLWKKQAHFLVPLTSLIDKKKGLFQWNNEKKVFLKYERILRSRCALSLPRFLGALRHPYQQQQIPDGRRD